MSSLRLLSIDGGGVRGLSAILILKEILYRIQRIRKLEKIPRACDVFDLAGGTGTGGIIVIMLFRLRMSIDDAKNAFVDLLNSVFSERKRWPRIGAETPFDTSRLEDSLGDIIQKALRVEGQSKDMRILDEEGPKCFVCATTPRDASSPTLFRSWIPSANPTFNCTIVEACRATTADMPIFPPIMIGEPLLKETFIGGRLRWNNPVHLVLKESKSAFPDRTTSCVVSIGAGTRDIIGMKEPNDGRLILQQLATDCESRSEETANLFSAKPGIYFRLNVEQGLQGIGDTESKELPNIKTHTTKYFDIHKVNQEVNRLVQVLAGPSASPPSTLSEAEDREFQKLKNSIAISAYYDSEERSSSSECLPGTRKHQINTLVNWIEANEKSKPLFIVLGPAGSGKSSILRTIARMCKEKGCLAASFFFSGTDSARNAAKSLMNTISFQIAEAIPQLRPYVARSVEAEPTIFSRSLESQTQQLVLEPLNRLQSDYPDFSFDFHPRVVVIDALDECLELNDQRRVISVLAKVLAHESFPFLCLLSTRYDPYIEKDLKNILAPRIYGQVDLGSDLDDGKSDIRTYLRANIDHIRDGHIFGTRMPPEWPSGSDIEAIVEKSGGQFIYASTVIRYIGSSRHNPHKRLQEILGISTTRSGTNIFAELDALYRDLMTSVGDLASALEILGIAAVRSSSHFWTPDTMELNFTFKRLFRSLDADIMLAPLAPVLKYEHGEIMFYHLSFAEFLIDPARSVEFFVHPTKWQKWIVSRLVPHFYYREWIWANDVLHLIENAKPGTFLHDAINDGLSAVALPSGGDFNIWPFVIFSFFRQLRSTISVAKMATIFAQRGQDFLSLPILLKMSSTTNLSNSFLLFELCRTFAAFYEAGFIEAFPGWILTSVASLSHFMTYLARYVDDQNILLPDDYLSASLRCLFYLTSSSCDIRASLKQQSNPLRPIVRTFGTLGYLENTSSNLTRGAIEVLPVLLAQAPPTTNLLAALKQPYDNEVLSMNPSSSCKALCSKHEYLVQHDPGYQNCQPSISVQEEPPDDFLVFLHSRGSKLPWWVMVP